ncbi:MAG: aminoacetone oxidase family FAD-binding enzyme [Candidatus Pacebacteria bacterium]|nr:aminoacetone oxidase family FAD-binding enzyme [Candidatus Paceibacterota bacterium]
MKNVIWDVIVIGGGPAGMMAAGRAAERGKRVLLIEKNDSLGKKLLITGGGRCNVTNAEFDNRKILAKFKDAEKFLFSPFSEWNVQNTLDFFNSRNMPTKVEKEQRVFPVSNSAKSVWDVLVEYINKNGVEIISNSPVSGFVLEDGKIIGVKVRRDVFIAKSFILATGGTSRPETGSTGDGYKWLKEIGHKVIDSAPSLVPLASKDVWIKRLAGVSLSDIKITTTQNGEKQDVKKGKILFTHVGISGPTILNMSKDVGELLKYGDVVIYLDLLPTHDHAKLNSALQEIFKENDKKNFKNSLSGLIPSSIVPIIVELSGIDPDIKCNSITREARMNLIQLIKNIPINVDKLLGTDKAVVSSGGVILDEVDFKTMSSRIYPNLYLIGDILNIDRPSGGYSLQLCWTTGFVAGNNS